MRKPILIIAEAGVNHNGSLDQARRLIDIAAEACADLVKFQTFNADRLVTPEARKATYQLQGGESLGTQYQMLKDLELSRDMHEELIAHCEEVGIGFFSTGFDVESNIMLHELGFQRFKIPSGEITNLPYLRHIGGFRLPLILSTGMAQMNEIIDALEVLEEAGTPRSMVTVLHCNTQYPTRIQDVNLLAMVSIRETLGVKVGYSDHTLGIEVPVAAAALGATVIEKHFTLDRSLPGPDHQASLEPEELCEMVTAIRNIESALGDSIKRPSPSEIANLTVVRKSIIALKDIKAGEKFTNVNVTVKRPGTGISPMLWDAVIGTSAIRDFEPDELIEL
jgi:N,N'-diacetyllegionaminate synthase